MRISEVKNVMQSVIIQNYENIKKGASKDRLDLFVYSKWCRRGQDLSS